MLNILRIKISNWTYSVSAVVIFSTTISDSFFDNFTKPILFFLALKIFQIMRQYSVNPIEFEYSITSPTASG